MARTKKYRPIHHLKPEKIAGIKVRGRILESNKNEFKFIIEPKNKEIEEKLTSKIYTIKSNKDNYVNPNTPVSNSYVYLIYLNEQSLMGLYKDPEKNLPYEVLGINWGLFYRQNIKESKKKILEDLKQSELEEKL